MKIQTTLFVFALSAASCGTVSADVSDGSGLTTTEGACSDCGESCKGCCDEGKGDAQGAGGAGSAGAGSVPAPAPAGETAPTQSVAEPEVSAAARQFAGLEMFEASAIVVTRSSQVGVGCYVGNLVLDQKRSKVTGAGVGQTVIDGNLIVGGQCKVSGLTVTGDVIFTGNNARVDVECLGQVLDYGLQNRH